jgi:hypothetical protein
MKIEIDLENAGKHLAPFAIVLLLIVVIVGSVLVLQDIQHKNEQISNLQDLVSKQIVVVQPTPVPTPTPEVPTTIVFTVLTTTASPNYEVTTTTGQILFCTDYYTWNMLVPRSTYSAVISGSTISSPVLIRSGNDEMVQYSNYPVNYYPVNERLVRDKNNIDVRRGRK